MGVVDLPVSQLEARELILDGYNGQIYASPSTELKRYYEDIVEGKGPDQGAGIASLLAFETRDGHKVPLWVNTGLMTDVVRSLNHGAEG